MLPNSTFLILVCPAKQRRCFLVLYRATTTIPSPLTYLRSVLASRQKSSWLTCKHMALPKPGTDQVSLQKFVDSLESHMRGLEALNKRPDSYGDRLVCILLDKLSADLRRNLAQQNDAAEWDLNILRKSLLKEIEILKDSESSVPHSSALKPPKKLNMLLMEEKDSTKESSQRKRFCPFYTGEHWPTDCDTTKSFDTAKTVDLKIGYLISGRLNYPCEKVDNKQQTLGLNVLVQETFDVTQFWELETLGIQLDLESTKITKFYQESSVEFRDGIYVAELPWSESHPSLSYLQTCQKRTRARQAARNSNGLKLYNKIIQEQMDRNFIERAPSAEINKLCHYIPHFGVFKESATTPLRIVYDCSCKTPAGVSLNDCLEIGLPLQNDMLAILLRSCVHTIGLTAFIEKAFHQIDLHEQDRDFM